ncbi:tRNA glutamyl-Q(34) synthetase GluQRS [Insolitispirillum peregrinum]|uniref:Glutamyl-Q tRNA(Asp) synthetase n=1 Tax=Insolitispirillum peregrinum TaxID=80876 RepID=A0A1N7MXM6_9PROT|nr:tRNA glutamyl-Q(34) synthetase GluQRS [Insolitispirillum peregrinum]SIS90832.1 glutamyl-Q tRNA(Asp) synthetase [Insolitispirillum peregrinum]
MPGDVTRFAPSPTGFLHLGHAHAALFAAAHAVNGRFLLRIEDIDQTRCRPEYTAAVFDDLAWLGLHWEQPVRQQSQHLEDYRQALGTLEQLGVLYPCFCTRADIVREVGDIHRAPHGPDGVLYPGTCRGLSRAEAQERLAAGLPYALRLDVQQAQQMSGGPLLWTDRRQGVQRAEPQIFGDVVLARKDTPTSYHLAVTVDDALQGVTLVTRGEDLRAATDVHRLLQALLDLPTPDYQFHGLLCGPDGKRLAKRDQAKTLRAMRAEGLTARDVHTLAGF